MDAPQLDKYRIWCRVKGAEDSFPVDIEPKATIYDLKEAIKDKKKHDFDSVDADRLTLYLIDIADDANFEENLNQKFNNTEHAPERPKNRQTLAASFGLSGPAEGSVHIFVKLPETPTSSSPRRDKRSAESLDQESGRQIKKPRYSGPKAGINSLWSPRTKTVAAILELLLKNRVVQVRGTPASGKTTLLLLLHDHIQKSVSDAEITYYRSWTQDEFKVPPQGVDNRLEYFLPGYDISDNTPRFFLFDEGQVSYWDRSLWQAFKDHFQIGANLAYAIIFCSYGNEKVRDPEVTTPFDFPAKVLLDRVVNGASTSYGLLLDPEEFDQVLERQVPKLKMDNNLHDFVFSFTGGHVGHLLAVSDFLVKMREGSMLRGTKYSLEDFHADTLSMVTFTRYLSGHFLVSRGMPELYSEYAPAMRPLLIGPINIGDVTLSEHVREMLKSCHKLGFIHFAQNEYQFPSPLARQVWSWHLQPDPAYQLSYTSLLEFVKATVEVFRPSQLTQLNRRVGVSSHRPPEAQYQDEFYRCVHSITHGNVSIFPEYAAAAGARPGRIDFFIPLKKWGIELTRDGSKLEEHASRFAAGGGYGIWLQDSDMSDYVLLDFRKSIPRVTHPTIQNLFHIVFDDAGTSATIYDNKLGLIHTMNLIHNH